uniref:LysM domain-containing protein n=1 Tax=Hanusia phi TaxID=3032 RepID=A0A7S0HB80_9CRYP
MCSSGNESVEICLDFQVARCKYAVNMEQTIAEIAAIFGTDWIQIFNLNAMTSPDLILFRHQVLNIGHLYSVSAGDSLDSIARRFGTSPRSIMFLNYELGELNTTNITLGAEICIIANSCFGEIQSFWDQNPKLDQSLDRWYTDVMAAYNELRRAKAAALAASGALPPV